MTWQYKWMRTGFHVKSTVVVVVTDIDVSSTVTTRFQILRIKLPEGYTLVQNCRRNKQRETKQTGRRKQTAKSSPKKRGFFEVSPEDRDYLKMVFRSSCRSRKMSYVDQQQLGTGRTSASKSHGTYGRKRMFLCSIAMKPKAEIGSGALGIQCEVVAMAQRCPNGRTEYSGRVRGACHPLRLRGQRKRSATFAVQEFWHRWIQSGSRTK